MAIVGPNGSGKSNIADALRWVLGEQSGRLLRAKKLDDIIFAGSATRARSDRVEVTLTLDTATAGCPSTSQRWRQRGAASVRARAITSSTRRRRGCARSSR